MTKRRHPRKIAAWPAWVRFHQSAKYVKGRTRDVSRGGAYIVMPVDSEDCENAPVEFILGIPSRQGDHWAIQSVSGQATIVRVERGDDGGLALRFVDETDLD